MTSPKIFAATDLNVLMTISSGFNIADINDITLTLTKNTIDRVFKLSTGEIAINGSTLIATIGSNMIVEKGTYSVAVRLLDKSNKIRGITVTPEELEFE